MNSRYVAEKAKPIRIGFIAQMDCAALVVAHETGIFQKHGLDVALSRELGWASIRDKICFGHLDAAQSIAGISIGLALGLGMIRSDVTVPLVFSLEGNAITLSTEIGREKIGLGEGLNDYLSYEWKKDRPMILAVPHTFSPHLSLLTTWLARHKVHHNRKLEIISLPSFLMPRHLRAGHIDGFCAPDPWNTEAIFAGTGWCPATSADIADTHPESVFMVSSEFRENHKTKVISLVSALIESSQLCQDPSFRKEMTAILSRREYLACSRKTLWNSLGNEFHSTGDHTKNRDFQRFSGGDTNRPTIEKASWVLADLRKNKTIPNHTGGSLSTIFREDIYLEAERFLAASTKTKPDTTPTTPSLWSRQRETTSTASTALQKSELEKA